MCPGWGQEEMFMQNMCKTGFPSSQQDEPTPAAVPQASGNTGNEHAATAAASCVQSGGLRTSARASGDTPRSAGAKVPARSRSTRACSAVSSASATNCASSRMRWLSLRACEAEGHTLGQWHWSISSCVKHTCGPRRHEGWPVLVGEQGATHRQGRDQGAGQFPFPRPPPTHKSAWQICGKGRWSQAAS